MQDKLVDNYWRARQPPPRLPLQEKRLPQQQQPLQRPVRLRRASVGIGMRVKSAPPDVTVVGPLAWLSDCESLLSIATQ